MSVGKKKEIPCNDNSGESNILVQLGSDDDDMVHDALYLVKEQLGEEGASVTESVIASLVKVAIKNDDAVIDEVSSEVLAGALKKYPEHTQNVIIIAEAYLEDTCPYARERAMHALGQVGLSDLQTAPMIRDVAFMMSRDHDIGVRVEAQVVIDQLSAAMFSDEGQPERVKRLPFFFRSGLHPKS